MKHTGQIRRRWENSKERWTLAQTELEAIEEGFVDEDDYVGFCDNLFCNCCDDHDCWDAYRFPEEWN